MQIITTISENEIDNIIGVNSSAPNQYSSPAYNRNIPNATANMAKQLTSQKLPAPNLYAPSDRAPYLIIMQQQNINEISISRHIIACNLVGVKDIRKLGPNSVQVECKDLVSANNIIQCQKLRLLHNINSFIPNEYVKSIGIVKNVPLDLTNDDISDFIKSSVPIERIKRINFWDKETKQAKPGTSLKITFRSADIPQNIVLYYTIKKVEHFIPKVPVCNKCLRFGHIARSCRSTETKCVNCSEPTHAASDTSCNGSCTHCQKTMPNEMQQLCS